MRQFRTFNCHYCKRSYFASRAKSHCRAAECRRAHRRTLDELFGSESMRTIADVITNGCDVSTCAVENYLRTRPKLFRALVFCLKNEGIAQTCTARKTTPAEFVRLLYHQDGCCGVCRVAFWNSALELDVAAGGRIRGLLCRKCISEVDAPSRLSHRPEAMQSYLRNFHVRMFDDIHGRAVLQ